jgi:diguanylate cyclase (GGDEF)-like protein
VVEDAQLVAVLSEFARTLLTDYPVKAILDRLVRRIGDVLPLSGASISLVAPGWGSNHVAASSELGLRLARVQSGMHEGPANDAFVTGDTVSAPDLTTDDRYPLFAQAAREGGILAAFSFPLQHPDGRLGTLDLYRDTAGPLSERQRTTAQILADVAAAYLLNARNRQEALDLSDRFRHSALHDALTGLPNRVLLQQRLEHAAERARRSHTHTAVLFVDLDNFKLVNDRYGHLVGDRLLVAVANRLTSLVRPGDTLARVSGDEFVILCEDFQTPDPVERLADRIKEAFGDVFTIADDKHGPIDLYMTASVGIAFSGRGEQINDQLVRDADIAMYQAKRKGGGAYQVIDLRQAAHDHDRAHLQRDLAQALLRNELHVAYQPIVRAADGVMTGVEALLRWTHPERGPISAVNLVSVAEQYGLIVEIGAWILRRSCEDRMRWLRDHPDRPLDLSVNVAGRQMLAPGMRESIAEVLDDLGMEPSGLTLEVNEAAFVDDGPRAMMILQDLKNIGVHLALDDFGTGFSSLGYLRDFSVDIVKLDRGFIADIDRARSGEVMGAVTSLAHALGLRVTAEGVETQKQRDEVAAIGCESAQGYYFARPMPAARVEDILAANGHRGLRLPDFASA